MDAGPRRPVPEIVGDVYTHTRRQRGKAGVQTSLLSLLVGGLFVLIPSGDRADKHTAENSQARSHNIPLLDFSVYFSPSKRIKRVRNSGFLLLGEGRFGSAWWGFTQLPQMLEPPVPFLGVGSKPKGGRSQLITGEGLLPGAAGSRCPEGSPG